MARIAKTPEMPERERGACCDVKLQLRDAEAEELTTVLKALADPTRLQMVLTLREAADPVCICDFTAAFDLTQPTVSHHMSRLREAGLVEATRQGIWVYYRLKPQLPPKVQGLIKALG